MISSETAFKLAVERNLGQAALLGEIADMTSTDYAWSARAQLNWIDGIWGSASSVAAHELHDKAKSSGVDLAVEAVESFTDSKPVYHEVMGKLLERLKGGSQLALTGAAPRDGDPRFDAVIWGHTLIGNTDSLLAFVGAHFMCMYVANRLKVAGVAEADQKDYAIGAMIDCITMRGIRDPEDPLFRLWGGQKPEFFGWVSNDRLQAFAATI